MTHTDTRTDAGPGAATGAGRDSADRGRGRGAHLLRIIGNTPLLPLPLDGLPPRVELWGKAEWLNPGGSVKDRAARGIVLAGERAGRLGAGRDTRLLDASSGNTAIAYAMIGAARGFGVTICMPANASAERKALLRAYGAEVIETDAALGSDGAIRRAGELAAEHPDRYWYADQYNNPANARAHYESTGPEIWRDTDGRVTHLVAGLGTTGTLIGTGRFLKERNGAIRLIAVEPDAGFHGIEGLKHLPSAIVPGLYDPDLPDRTLRVRTEDAYEMTRRLSREVGCFVGPSSGAVVAAALEVGAGLERAVIVAVLPDGGDRYLSLELWAKT